MIRCLLGLLATIAVVKGEVLNPKEEGLHVYHLLGPPTPGCTPQAQHCSLYPEDATVAVSSNVSTSSLQPQDRFALLEQRTRIRNTVWNSMFDAQHFVTYIDKLSFSPLLTPLDDEFILKMMELTRDLSGDPRAYWAQMEEEWAQRSKDWDIEEKKENETPLSIRAQQLQDSCRAFVDRLIPLGDSDLTKRMSTRIPRGNSESANTLGSLNPLSREFKEQVDTVLTTLPIFSQATEMQRSWRKMAKAIVNIYTGNSVNGAMYSEVRKED
ncbi:unnamed protein product [Vitrella brassicaformis CCMP3155]|uniref:Uncharacterized protein n=1 Tax=Vitrella brassicaformis (strain CCMP3155) TaxID=1169540 RepID=A0A0G4EW76_VITBC|nr:unnamed protein product [Vitrella brassicaformis CCMP3155]|eukprot:CEM02503.1 unnamed protein product [Vitrella brassicaformis CCMP3155]